MEPVLVAVSDDARVRLAAILAGRELVFAASVDEVRSLLRRGRVAAVVAGSHFGESTTLELLQALAAGAAPCPVICVQAVPFHHGLGKSTFRAFRTACLELGAKAVVDLLEYPDDEAGNARVRAALEPYLTAHVTS